MEIQYPIVKAPRMTALNRRALSHANADDGFSRSYRHFITCRAKKEPFPLEKVPPEVRRMIFRLGMPDDRFEPLHESEYDWNDPYDGRILVFDDCNKVLHEGRILGSDDDCMEEKTKRQTIPNSLFEVRGFMANEALAVFYNETYFRGSGVYRDPSNYKHGSYRIKEWIRLVSDELLAKNIIQTLIITAPCKCALEAAGLLPKDEASIFDLFTPLKRTHVPNLFILSLHNDRRKTGIKNPCSKPACLQLTHNIQAQLGRLDGEPLSEQEATWKECKLRYRDDAKLEKKAPLNKDSLFDDLYSRIESVWEVLSGIHIWETTFEEAVQDFRKHLVEREQKREERRVDAREERREQEREEKRQLKRKEEQVKKRKEEQEKEQS
ncbi:MAG: hypothetical protein Q9171_004079 [Xanthocarpia ochracea]